MDEQIAGVKASENIPISITNKENIFSDGQQVVEKSKKDQFKKLIITLVSIFVIVVVIVAGTYGYIIYKGYQNNHVKASATSIVPSTTPTPTVLTAVSPLTGMTITGADSIANLKRPPLAIMIENSTPARPQTGLNQADLVYETLTEGGITRFMAVFLSQTPQIVGPVRSARTFFLDWASEYNPIYAHWGQNSDVAPSLIADQIRNVDAIFQPGTSDSCTKASGLFCRDFTRDAPHNGYGFPSKIWADGVSNSWNTASSITPWTFKTDASVAKRGKDGGLLNVTFMPNDTDYNVLWQYNQANNTYTRFDGPLQQIDKADNSPIITKNIVLQFVNGNMYTSSGGKDVYKLQSIGSGKASIFEDGVEVDGTWKKDSLTGRTQYFDSLGNPVQFNQGKTWISVLVTDQGGFTFNN